jgi:hypothetical protein
MSGHVFHPGHEELHGITVVLGDREGRTYVGRYHEATSRGVVLHDVAVHEADAEGFDRGAWLRQQLRFGVQVMHRTLVVSREAAVGPVTRLTDLVL